MTGLRARGGGAALALALALALAGAGCTGGGGGGGGAEPRGATTNGEGEACGERLGFSETSWEPAPRVPPNVPAGTVLWQARFTFTNPNPVEVRLSDAVVILELDSADGHRAGAGRTAFLEPAAAAVAPRSTLERSAQAWLRDGKIPKTTQVYAATQATIGGVACSVAVERVSTTPPSPQVFTLADCGAEPC